MKGITQLGSVATVAGAYFVHLSKNLRDGSQSMFLGHNIYFLESLTKEQIANDVLGFVSRDIYSHVTGREMKKNDWPDGLWFGKRQIHVELVKTGTEPAEFLFDNDESTLLVLDTQWIGRNKFELIRRLFLAGHIAFKTWEQDALRRQLRREQPVFGKSFVADPATPAKAAKPRLKRRVRPGELLDADERDATLKAGDEVLRQILDDRPRGAA